MKGTGDNIGEWNEFFFKSIFFPAIQVLCSIFFKKKFICRSNKIRYIFLVNFKKKIVIFFKKKIKVNLMVD